MLFSHSSIYHFLNMFVEYLLRAGYHARGKNIAMNMAKCLLLYGALLMFRNLRLFSLRHFEQGELPASAPAVSGRGELPITGSI